MLSNDAGTEDRTVFFKSGLKQLTKFLLVCLLFSISALTSYLSTDLGECHTQSILMRQKPFQKAASSGQEMQVQ